MRGPGLIYVCPWGTTRGLMPVLCRPRKLWLILTPLWTGKSDKSSKIINPQSVKPLSKGVLNLTKRKRGVQALQPSAEGVTPVVSHYSSYPASFGEFLAPDAPEHSLLVNTSPALIPHLDTHSHTHTSSYFSTDGSTSYSTIREALIPFIVRTYSKRYHGNILLRLFQRCWRLPAIQWITLNVLQLQPSNYNLWLNAPNEDQLQHLIYHH